MSSRQFLTHEVEDTGHARAVPLDGSAVKTAAAVGVAVVAAVVVVELFMRKQRLVSVVGVANVSRNWLGRDEELR